MSAMYAEGPVSIKLKPRSVKSPTATKQHTPIFCVSLSMAPLLMSRRPASGCGVGVGHRRCVPAFGFVAGGVGCAECALKSMEHHQVMESARSENHWENKRLFSISFGSGGRSNM